jgi:hypothetical protein
MSVELLRKKDTLGGFARSTAPDRGMHLQQLVV